MPLGDEEIDEDALAIRRVLEGDATAYASIVQRHQRRLFVSLSAILGSREDAEDVTQECFVLGYRKLSTFEGRSSLFTWLHRIGVNLALSHRRKHRREKSMTRNPFEVASEDLMDREEPVEAAMDRADQQSLVRAAIMRLDPQQRSILVLRDVQGLDYSEISFTLEIPIGTVRSRLHRARIELKQHLELFMKR